MEIELWTAPPPPPRPEIRVTIPHLECDVSNCDRPLQADMVWNDHRQGAIHLQQVCGYHLHHFRELVKAEGGAVFFPLNSAPPLEYIAAKMQEEMRRRRPAPVYQPMWGNLNYTFTQTGTGMGGTWVSFG